MKNQLAYFLLILFLASCTITKRHYHPGYHVQWHKQVTIPNKSQPTENASTTTHLSADEKNMATQQEQHTSTPIPPSIQAAQDISSRPAKIKTQPLKQPVATKPAPIIQPAKSTRPVKPLPPDDKDLYDAQAARSANKALVRGILSFILLFVISCFSTLIALSAIRNGLEAQRSNKDNKKLQGKAKTGVVFGKINIVLLMLVVLFSVGFIFYLLSGVASVSFGFGIPFLVMLLVLHLVLTYIYVKLFFTYVV